MAKNTIVDLFRQINKDKKILFIILASILISLPVVVSSDMFWMITAVSVSYSWVIFSWVITNRSVFRKTWQYFSVFVLVFIGNFGWFKLLDSIDVKFFPSKLTYLQNFLIAIPGFIATLVVVLLVWRLTRPKDFKKSEKWVEIVKKPRFAMSISAAFFIQYLPTVSSLLLDKTYIVSIFFMALGWLLISIVVTRIRSKVKYWLHGIIFFVAMIPMVYYSLDWSIFIDNSIYMNSIGFLFTFVSYFILFVSLLLLSKPRYLE
ncbi:MAG: hypothetical protein V5A64_04565 [Candidatus Thermoplasmatota archaeon]